MKKKKETVQKPKDFASTPFKSLKGVLREPAAATPIRSAPQPKLEEHEDDGALFFRAVADVRRLHQAQNAAGKDGSNVPGPVPPGSDEDRQLFLEALGDLRLDVTFRDELPAEDEPLRPLAVNRMRELKRGAIRVDFQLDLHGLTRDEAVASLAAFVAGAWNRGQKAVLVITGKGNRSPGEPVLQQAVTSWLREKGKGVVAEFAPAPRDLGGGGALVVFLKNREHGMGGTP